MTLAAGYTNETMRTAWEVILSKQSLSREIAINRIRDALGKAGVGVIPPQVNPS